MKQATYYQTESLVIQSISDRQESADQLVIMQIVTNYKWRQQKHALKAGPTTRVHLDLGGATRCGYRYTPNYRGRRSAWVQGQGTIEDINCQRCLDLIEQESQLEDMPGRTGGRLLLKFRMRAGRTQVELAADAETIQGGIQAYESGSRIPSSCMLFRLSEALNLSADDREQLFHAYGRDQKRARTAPTTQNRTSEIVAHPV